MKRIIAEDGLYYYKSEVNKKYSDSLNGEAIDDDTIILFLNGDSHQLYSKLIKKEIIKNYLII